MQVVDIIVKFVTALIEERKGAPLVELLSILGGWPVLNDSWDATKFDMENLLGQLKLIGNVVLVNLAVGPDAKDSSVNVIQVSIILINQSR